MFIYDSWLSLPNV